MSLPETFLPCGDAPIMLDVTQGSEEWLTARRGIPTASNFKRIITASGKLSGSARQYLEELADEYRNGKALDTQSSEPMRRGIELEPEARSVYESQTGVAVAQIGLVYLNQHRMVAASPDGLVGGEGLLEIKCPMDNTHNGYLRAGRMPSTYIPQVQGQLWVTARRWCDFFSYHPGCAPLLIRVYRDEPYIAKLRTAVTDFVTDLLAETL